MIDPDDYESIHMKDNLYKCEDGKWSIDESIAHRAMSNNSIMYKTKPSREQLHWHMERQRYSGEPGFVNLEAMMKRRPNANGTNPCVSGDTEILTNEGYVKIIDLVDKPTTIWNGFEWSEVTPSKTGENEKLYKVNFSNGSYVKCTSYHKWVLENGTRVKTINLNVGATLLKWHNVDIWDSSEFVYVTSIEELEGLHDVYCMNEPKNHTFIANGVITGNCGEVLLDSHGMCNLTTINCMKFVDENGNIDLNGFLRAQYLSARAGFRMTMLRLELNDWDSIQKRDRLVGCSLTGWQDFVNKSGIDKNKEASILRLLRDEAHRAVEEYAKELNVNAPLLSTSIKPEGCTHKKHVRTFKNGIFMIDELNPSIYNKMGFTDIQETYLTQTGDKVTKTYKNDVKDLIKIVLDNNREFIVTPTHPISVNGVWTPAKDIRPGKDICIDADTGLYLNDKNASLSSIGLVVKDDDPYVWFPGVMTEELAWLLGAYYGCGSKTSNTIKFSNKYYDVCKRWTDYFKTVFRVMVPIEKYSSDGDVYYVATVENDRICKWMNANGFSKYNGDEVTDRIPLSVRTSSKDVILSFMTGFFDVNGNIMQSSIEMSDRNEKLLRHIQEVGEAVGVILNYNEDDDKKTCSLGIRLADTCVYAIEYFKSHTSRMGLGSYTFTNSFAKWNQVKYVSEYPAEYTYDVEVENSHWYFAGALKSHNTISCLPTVSSGVHYSHSEYYIRRVRINANDPLVKVCEELGYPIYPENGETLENCKTKVVEFPLKAPAGKTKFDVSAIEQLENYKLFMDNYVDHNCSITVSVRDDEWDDVEEWVWNNWDSIVGITFLSLCDSFYTLMPFEAITKEEYEKRISNFKHFNHYLIQKFEKQEVEYDVGNDGCESGHCPTR